MPVPYIHSDPYTIVTEAEERRLNWIQRNLGPGVSVYSTSRYANASPAPPDINGNVVVKRSILAMLLPTIILPLMGVGMGFIYFNFRRAGIFPGFMLLPFGLFFLVITGMALYNLRRTGVNITLNKEGIEIGANRFSWKKIRATYLVKRPQGKATVSFLVLVMEDDTLEYFELTAFPTWTSNFKMLCTAIRDFHSVI